MHGKFHLRGRIAISTILALSACRVLATNQDHYRHSENGGAVADPVIKPNLPWNDYLGDLKVPDVVTKLISDLGVGAEPEDGNKHANFDVLETAKEAVKVLRAQWEGEGTIQEAVQRYWDKLPMVVGTAAKRYLGIDLEERIAEAQRRTFEVKQVVSKLVVVVQQDPSAAAILGGLISALSAFVVGPIVWVLMKSSGVRSSQAQPHGKHGASANNAPGAQRSPVPLPKDTGVSAQAQLEEKPIISDTKKGKGRRTSKLKGKLVGRKARERA
ncbi:hypothetical protein BOTBODRAFT_45324 [Botryobasidium botryosum FD-172 SS1]|uniref:Uncharacterized protein n=1 Tax=Botryobasidium botryosum (strain FD-172 SS1) TaxID=930990 RepID=A0A067MFF8_BOTB1|nr:hypothetical protein BOTBODRAFT_45324 [Botryobasidium botryosum FD-172 SS1]